jgi:peptidyl-prolyl cis-trans isomerase SurA
MQKGLISLLILATAPALHAAVLNRIVLRVNDQIATLMDYQNRKEEYLREVLRRESDPQERTRLIAEAGEEVFSDMFRDLLLQSRADQLGIEITDAQIDESVGQVRQNFGIRTDEEFVAALGQSGLTLEQFRAQMKSNLRVQEVRGREVQGKVKVDEDDLRRYYRKNQEEFRLPEQIKVHEVVVLEEGGESPAYRQALAESIRREATSGKTLAQAVEALAKPGATSSVIDHGWVSKGDLDKSLEAAAWPLKAGEVSQPIAARGGLHLLQVAERRESRIPPFADVQAKIRAREQERVFRDEISKYMVELEKKALIVADPPQEAANFRDRLAAKETIESGLEDGSAAPVDPSAPIPPAATPPATLEPVPPPPSEKKPPQG